jgi:hypothetical protein
MDLQGGSVLELIAELAVALAGFSGVVTALRGGKSKEWERADLVRLVGMLHASFLAGGLALVPFIFFHFGLRDGAVWGFSGAVGALVQAARLAGRRARTFSSIGLPESGRASYWTFRAITVVTMLLYFSQAIGVPFGRTFGPYLVALLLHLSASAALFYALLTSRVRAV